jgi:S-DNA-T family DNA segregation ATPase FtsK/SpoIIIE
MFNPLTLIPPVFMVVIMLFFRGDGKIQPIMIGTMMMSMSFPLINVIWAMMQRRKYKIALKQREVNYRKALELERNRLLGLVQRQRSELEHEYPRVSQVIDLALARGSKNRLWWRRPLDSDFLYLRIGKGKGLPTFTVEAPKFSDDTDPLATLPNTIIREFEDIPELPFMIDLKKVGSIGIAGNEADSIYKAVRRLCLDVLVHHSPNDVQLIVVSNNEDGMAKWGWLKWAPHTDALNPGNKTRFIALRQGAISDTLEWLKASGKQRRDRQNRPGYESSYDPAIVVIFDDNGRTRQQADLSLLVERGYEIGIYMIFVGDKNLPRVRARLDVSDQKAFRYVETWEKGSGQRGQAEFVDLVEAETVARALSKLEPLGEKTTITLPEGIRLSEILDIKNLHMDAIKNNWTLLRSDRELLQFPIGVQVGREGLETALINLLPESKGGEDAYHTILIGTTGSGKSEFMKSLVLGAAHKYSAAELNFFFMDFKGGAAFNVFKDLPHVVGIVTNLAPELVERGLDALESEIERRQQKFAASEVQNIWAYNKKYSSQPMPHLLLLLDEFARGMEDFPKLPDILQLLVRQGRSLGMYLILANQDVNSKVDTLLNNVGWRIALKVAKPEEMHIISKDYPPAKRAGQGYLRSLNGDINEFQSGYAGLPVLSQSAKSAEEFTIYEVGPDGEFKQIYRHSPNQDQVEEDEYTSQTEQDYLITLMKQAACELELAPVPRIYLDPLANEIYLGDIIGETALRRTFIEAQWSEVAAEKNWLATPVGYLDFPKDCKQRPLVIDFTDQDGHLWIVGSPGSGKAMSLTTILLSLAVTHTPEEVNFYVLEYGAGSLKLFENLPHTGAVIRLDEKERLERLLNYLDQEMSRRTRTAYDTRSEADGDAPTQTDKGKYASAAEIFLVINNFAELRSTYPDHADRISRYVRDGKAARIHLIITTNRGGELPRMVSNNIARRLILYLASRDEYSDVAMKMIRPLSTRVQGRGYWVSDGIAECQIALPVLPLPEGASQIDIVRELGKQMKTSWKGLLPRLMDVLPATITLSQCLDQIWQQPFDSIAVPVGLSYETLELVSPNLVEEIPQWLILGPRQCGKSNFLSNIALSILSYQRQDWQVKIFSLRRNSLLNLANQEKGLSVYSTPETILQEASNLIKQYEFPGSRDDKLFLLIDDLGGAFEVGKETIATNLDKLASVLGASNDVYIMATAMKEELQGRQASPLVRLLRQSRTGMVFSVDLMDMDWLGVSASFLSPSYRKLDLPQGRGFFVSRGKAQLVQTPRADKGIPVQKTMPNEKANDA